MQKYAVLSVLAVALVIISGVWVWQQNRLTNDQTGDNQILVTASFYPLAEFARQVGGSLVNVQTVVPAGSEPHDYEPTPAEMARVYKSKLFIYNGNGVDPWAERVAADLRAQGVHVLNMSEHVEVQMTASHPDPHFWLDPVLAQTEVQEIVEALTDVDPVHHETYTVQGKAYQQQLALVDKQYRVGLRTCSRRDIVTSHAAFGYLAQRYNLAVTTIAGISPEEEPSARRLSEITQLVKQKNIKAIFFETLVSPKLAQTIAQETGAQTLVFNPLEGLSESERQAGKNYLTVMADNLQNLRIALDCR